MLILHNQHSCDGGLPWEYSNTGALITSSPTRGAGFHGKRGKLRSSEPDAYHSTEDSAPNAGESLREKPDIVPTPAPESWLKDFSQWGESYQRTKKEADHRTDSSKCLPKELTNWLRLQQSEKCLNLSMFQKRWRLWWKATGKQLMYVFIGDTG